MDCVYTTEAVEAMPNENLLYVIDPNTTRYNIFDAKEVAQNSYLWNRKSRVNETQFKELLQHQNMFPCRVFPKNPENVLKWDQLDAKTMNMIIKIRLEKRNSYENSIKYQ